MKPEMRQMLARESYAEKIRKVGQLIRLTKTFPRRQPASPREKLFAGESVEERFEMTKKL